MEGNPSKAADETPSTPMAKINKCTNVVLNFSSLFPVISLFLLLAVALDWISTFFFFFSPWTKKHSKIADLQIQARVGGSHGRVVQ